MGVDYTDSLEELGETRWTLLVGTPETKNLIETYTHELGNHQAKLDGYRQFAEEKDNLEKFNGLASDIQGDEEMMAEFLENLEQVRKPASRRGLLLESTVEDISNFKGYFEGQAGVCADSVIDISTDILDYQKRLGGIPARESIEVQELLEPGKNIVESCSTDLEFNGHEKGKLAADYGARIITWTLAKNWKDHADRLGADHLNSEITRDNGFYEINLWDDGKGLFEKHSTKEQREQWAEKLFQNKDGGHGLSTATKIADLYDGSIQYTEEKLEEKGFGVKLRLPVYQNSTSDPS
ncbi:MAG: hypothetical protein BRC29_01505 [Nanohaloarchaea archaeon SW_7_43_1]|nr:MAG: hypothetical protein BRC29_01505 [Nanohaloarchaea archaeon SW_7_43_1]